MPEHDKMIVWLILSAVVMRLLFSFLFDPLVTPDYNSYLETARQISSRDFSSYIGDRTPVFPLILLIFRYNIQAVVFFQMILGVAITLVVFKIFQTIQDRRSLGFAAGISYALNPSMVLFERALLTETTAIFFVAVSVLSLVTACERGECTKNCVFLGILCSLTALTKPLFQFLPFLFALLIAARFFIQKRRVIGATNKFILVVIPAAILLGSWSWFNYSKTGYFGLSTMLGMGLMNHTGAFIENAPPEYDDIKKVFLKYREPIAKEKGRTYGAVHLAKKELMQITGQNYMELNKTFVRLSLSLVKANPIAYLKSVSRSFCRFWLPTWYTDQGGIRKVIRSESLPMALMVGTFVLVHVSGMLLFWVFPLYYVFFSKIRKEVVINFQVISVYGLVFFTAILQSLLEYSENSRYKASVEPLIIGMAVIFAMSIYRSLTRRSEEAK